MEQGPFRVKAEVSVMAGIICIQLLLFSYNWTWIILLNPHNTTEEIKLDEIKNLSKIMQSGSVVLIGSSKPVTLGSQVEVIFPRQANGYLCTGRGWGVFPLLRPCQHSFLQALPVSLGGKRESWTQDNRKVASTRLLPVLPPTPFISFLFSPPLAYILAFSAMFCI